MLWVRYLEKIDQKKRRHKINILWKWLIIRENSQMTVCVLTYDVCACVCICVCICVYMAMCVRLLVHTCHGTHTEVRGQLQVWVFTLQSP